MKTTLERPADSAGALYVKTPITPEEIFQAIGRLRKEARDEIDRLIRFLDDTENHMAIECEPEDEGDDAEDEPSLGSFDRMTDQSKAWRQCSLWAFPVADCEHDTADAEPALGSVDACGDQELWAIGDRTDLEPSLGGGGWSRSTDDCEIDLSDVPCA